MFEIKPIPDNYGVGFCSYKPIENSGFIEQKVGLYYNYLVSKDKWEFPASFQPKHNLKIDGFAPNLNKKLHVGHLRNLAVANSITKILQCKPVAMLGASLGTLADSEKELESWFNFIDYHPEKYLDTEISKDHNIELKDGEDDKVGCKVWNGVVCIKSDGKPTYALHDLAFAAKVSPDYYITGVEQKEHFTQLGLGNKHLPMGLVVGVDNKKIKSRTGDALSAMEAVQLVVENLEETKYPDRLSWNILSWNFLHCSRKQNVKFDVAKWVAPNAPGLYITYTYARIKNTLLEYCGEFADPQQIDLELMGYASYLPYWKNKCVQSMDSAPLAEYAHQLARKLGNAYHLEKICGGRKAFQYAVNYALLQLEDAMKCLGLFCLEKV